MSNRVPVRNTVLICVTLEVAKLVDRTVSTAVTLDVSYVVAREVRVAKFVAVENVVVVLNDDIVLNAVSVARFVCF